MASTGSTYATTVPGTTAPSDLAGPTAGHRKTGHVHRAFRFGPLAPFLMFCGTTMWLIGSALFVGSQGRANLPVLATTPAPVFGSGAIINDGLRTAAWILYIIACVFWILGSLLYTLRVHVMADLSKVYVDETGRPIHSYDEYGKSATVPLVVANQTNPMRASSGTGTPSTRGRQTFTPSLATWSVWASWMQLIATVLLLIGVAIWSGDSFGDVSTGAIIILIAFTLWGLSMLIALGVTFVTSSVVKYMGNYRQRRYAWNSFISCMFQTLQFILFTLASIALVVRDPPGIWLFAALLYLVGAVYGLWGWIVAMKGATLFMGPLMGYTTAAYLSVTEASAATGANQKPYAQMTNAPAPGPVFMPGPSATGLSSALPVVEPVPL